MTRNARDDEKAIVRKAMDMVVKSPRSIAEMEGEVRDFLRNAAAEAEERARMDEDEDAEEPQR